MKVEQTILTIEDLAEHHNDLSQIHQREQDKTDMKHYDDMLVRFAMTFTEGYDYG